MSNRDLRSQYERIARALIPKVESKEVQVSPDPNVKSFCVSIGESVLILEEMLSKDIELRVRDLTVGGLVDIQYYATEDGIDYPTIRELYEAMRRQATNAEEVIAGMLKNLEIKE